MFKKILCLALGLALLSMHITVCADEDGYSYTADNGVVYEYTVSGSNATITKINNASGELNIPSKIDQYTVTALGEKCSNVNNNILTLTLPGTVKEIGESAFAECRKINRISLGDGVETIKRYAFCALDSLTEITFPSSINFLADQSFAFCSTLKSVKFSGEIPEMESYAFRYCEALTDVNIEPQNSTVNFYAFKDTPWFDSVFSDNEYILRDNNKTLYKYNGNAEEFTVPDGVTKIEENAFFDSNVKKITLPESLTRIDSGAFNRTKELKNIEIKGNLEYIGDSAFESSGIEEFSIPDSVTTIGEKAFYGCEKLTNLTIENGVTSIGANAFSKCPALTNITIPDSVTSVGSGAFNCGENLTSVTIPANWGEIAYETTTVTQSIFKLSGQYLKNINYSGKFSRLIYYIFDGTDWIKQFADSDGFYIAEDCLLGYTGSSKNVVIPEGVKKMDGGVFNAKDIDSVSFPSTLENIGGNAFVMTNLKEVTIPSNIKTVGECAFMACPKLEKVVIEKGVEMIEFGAFQNCEKLNDVTYYEGTVFEEDVFVSTPYGNSISATAKPKATAEPDVTVAPAATATPAATPTAAPEILTVKTGEKLEIDIDGKSVEFTDAQPFIDANSRTQVPVRAVSEMLGCTVEWDDATKTATISNGDKTVSITIGSDTITVNGKSVKMDTAAVIANDRTYIPVRYAAEALGMTVQWE